MSDTSACASRSPRDNAAWVTTACCSNAFPPPRGGRHVARLTPDSVWRQCHVRTGRPLPFPPRRGFRDHLLFAPLYVLYRVHCEPPGAVLCYRPGRRLPPRSLEGSTRVVTASLATAGMARKAKLSGLSQSPTWILGPDSRPWREEIRTRQRVDSSSPVLQDLRRSSLPFFRCTSRRDRHR